MWLNYCSVSSILPNSMESLKIMYKNILKISAIVAMFSSSVAATATAISTYDLGPGIFSGYSALRYDSIQAIYNHTFEEFSFEVDYDGAAADGGWLVVSTGANPKHSRSELGIAYFDADSNDVWVYAYNGENNNESYTESPMLQYFEDAYSIVNGVATISFSTAQINQSLESGFEFGSRIGIWFHPSSNIIADGDAMGLNSFDAYAVGWFDTNFDGNCQNPNTGCITQVPEPQTLLMFVLGLGLILSRFRLARV